MKYALPLLTWLACWNSVLAKDNPPGLLLSEFLYESAPFPECHASTIAETSQGLVVSWFGGTREKHPDVGVWIARQVDGGWTTPVEVANGVQSETKRFPCWNPVLFQPRTGPLLLFYKVGPDPRSWWGMLTTSEDGGATWSAPTRLPENIFGPIKNKPVQLSTGEILSGTSTEDKGWRIHFERSQDLGRTWTRTPALNDGVSIGAIQPSILFLGGDHLMALGRTRQSKIFRIESTDSGKTWGKMGLTDLPNPNSGTDAVTLADGRHALVYNPTAKGRSPLSLAVSSDGKSWKSALMLEDTDGKEFSYPAIIQSKDGKIHVTYTWMRQRIRHAEIDLTKCVLKDVTNSR
jgi:predicted neuraminidase